MDKSERRTEAGVLDGVISERDAVFPGAGSPGDWSRAIRGATGETDPSAKPLKGFGGAAVMEIAAPFDGNTWRAIYTVRFLDVVYVLHAFQKKSRSGIATPKAEIALIHQRLAAAGRDYERRTN